MRLAPRSLTVLILLLMLSVSNVQGCAMTWFFTPDLTAPKPFDQGVKMKLNEGEKAGVFAMIYLWMALIAVWFTIGCIAWYHIKRWIS